MAHHQSFTPVSNSFQTVEEKTFFYKSKFSIAITLFNLLRIKTGENQHLYQHTDICDAHTNTYNKKKKRH